MKKMKSALQLGMLFISLFGGVTSALADTFPSRPVTLVVPYPPGGPIDVITRNVAQKLGEKWKQAVNVENKAGGSEVIAAQWVAAAKPDGYTMLVAGDPAMTVNQFTFKKLAYNPERDFTPVLRMVSFNMAFVVPSNSPVNSMQEFVTYAKSKPGVLAFGSAGLGGPVHFSYTDLKAVTGVDLNFAPYMGLTPILTDMMGGRIDATFGAVSVVEPYIKGGKLKALAMGGPHRSKALPDVPTFDELGFKGIDATFFTGLVVPSKTPADIVNTIAKDVREVMTAPDFIAKTIDPYALELVADDPARFKSFLAANRLVQAGRVKASGFQAN